MGASLEDIVSQQRMTNRLLVELVRGGKHQHEIIDMLIATGATVNEVAAVVGTTPATVTTTKVRANKKGGSGEGKDAKAKAATDGGEVLRGGAEGAGNRRDDAPDTGGDVGGTEQSE